MELSPGVRHHDDRALGVVDNLAANRAKAQMRESTATDCAHDQQVGIGRGEGTGKNTDRVAKALGWSPSKITRYEFARTGLRAREVTRWRRDCC
jgi:hypothetical protein